MYKDTATVTTLNKEQRIKNNYMYHLTEKLKQWLAVTKITLFILKTICLKTLIHTTLTVIIHSHVADTETKVFAIILALTVYSYLNRVTLNWKRTHVYITQNCFIKCNRNKVEK